MACLTVLATSMSGCLPDIFPVTERKADWLYGTVVKEHWIDATTVSVVSARPDRAVFPGNNSYVVDINTPDGLYTLDVRHQINSRRSIAGLAARLENGSGVKFVKGYTDYVNGIVRETVDFYGEDRVGIIVVDRIFSTDEISEEK